VTVGPSTLSADLLQLFASGMLADVRVIGKDGEVAAHRAILIARCPALLEQGLHLGDEEGRAGRVLRFPTLEAEVIQEVVQSLYSNVLCIVRPRTALRRANASVSRHSHVRASRLVSLSLCLSVCADAGSSGHVVWPDGAG
jgi:hypothetical protein